MSRPVSADTPLVGSAGREDALADRAGRDEYSACSKYGVVWYGMVWYGMVWYGMVWYGVVWYGIVCVVNMAG